MADEEESKEYRWETGYEKTWEAIKEDDDGLVEGSVAEIIQKAKRKRQAMKKGYSKLGMMRHLYIILDCSEAMTVPDLKPTRFICSLKLLEIFIEEFFDQNPISQLGLIALKAKRAEKITELAGSCRKHIKAVSNLSKISLIGEPSLQNGLDLALKTLKMVPSHASREVLVIMGSLTTCDPTDIHITIDALKAEGIRCSVVSLSAEIRVCKFLCTETGGVYAAVLDDSHFKDQLLQHIDPPQAGNQQECSMIKMGFPHGKTEESKDPLLTMCMCHIDSTDEPAKLTSGGYHCPQCYSKYCELPVECASCGLTLASAPHLARSYHHLFPVPAFHELMYGQQTASMCYGCRKLFTESADKTVYQCKSCAQMFCIDCDIFIHETMHSCVGCTTIPASVQALHARKPVAPTHSLSLI
ncbi:general transcription factor IIH subunit 2-like [Topomyia yanbarensis]|uniref:general transcription factor IIH subunit 2-like n=1 Tax=Topomyia yanbarensis TaxID=2498891 RepID=UPI00273B076A|nr:general transcription factor IIH subunit 2-like [Topomyia yanbarensis]